MESLRTVPAQHRTTALAAAWCAFAYAAVSAYWTAGGVLLLDTVGGAVERAARGGGAAAWTLGLTATVGKLAGAGLALVLRRPWPHRTATILRRIARAAGLALVAYGGALVVVGALVLGGAVAAPGADRHALAWHVGLWDLWFLVWGALLLGACGWPGGDDAPSAGHDSASVDRGS